MQIVWALVLIVASYVITALTTKPPQIQPPANFGDFQFPQAEEGTQQTVIFGDVWTGDWMVGWVGNYRSTAIKSSGGKK